MNLYLLSCENIKPYVQRILPLLPEQRQLSFSRSHSVLTLGAGLLLAVLLDVRKDGDLVFGEHGKPFLSKGKPEFSLSHSGQHVLLGVSDTPIGVDMERKGRRVPRSVRERICLPTETDLDPLTVFTRKECAMKLTGLGFSLPLRQIDTTAPFVWQNGSYRFFTTEADAYVISVATAEKGLPVIQKLSAEDLI